MSIIHLVSSFLWWSFTVIVVLIIRPLNKTGNLSIVLPRIQKIVSYTSTVSIVSGFIFFGIITNFQYYKLITTFWGNIIVLAGIFSLIVYYNVISGGKIQSFVIGLKISRKLSNKLPLVLLSLITASIMLMILISKVFVVGSIN
jgi:hypothetical protein